MNLNEKSRTVSFVLTVLLGPLGLMYSSFVGGLVLLVIALLTAPTIVGPVACWILAIAIGDHMTHRHNQNIEKFKGLVAK